MKTRPKQEPEQNFTISQIRTAWDIYKDKRVLMGNIDGELKIINAKPGIPFSSIPGLRQAQWQKFKDTPQGKDFPAFLKAFCNE